MELKEYAMKILKDAGCDEYTYGGKWADKVLDDLKEEFKPGELEYPYIDVANAILAISRPEPIKRAPYKMIWDTDQAVCGEDCETFEDAKAAALNVYEGWMEAEWMMWTSEKPTAKNIEDWNYMIYNCCCYIVRYDPRTDEYDDADDAYYLSDEELEEIGWKEIPETEESEG